MILTFLQVNIRAIEGKSNQTDKKEWQNKRSIANWRPISLIDDGLKIVSKAFVT